MSDQTVEWIFSIITRFVFSMVYVFLTLLALKNLGIIHCTLRANGVLCLSAVVALFWHTFTNNLVLETTNKIIRRLPKN